jgi:hypothetical protein
VVTGVVAAVVSVPMASVDGSVGPHRATYSVVTNHFIEFDLGPLGSLVLDSPLPWPLGIEVRVQEIPADLSATGNTALSLADDLDGYLQFFTQPDLAVRDAARDLVRDALTRSVLTWSVLLVLVAAGRLASRRGALRVELRTVLSRPGVAVLVVAVCVASAVGVVRDWRSGPSLEGRTSRVLAGTALADARIVGRLGDLVDTYGGYAVDAIEQNEEFYDAVTLNLVAAYEDDPEALAPDPRAVTKTLAPRAADPAGAPAGLPPGGQPDGDGSPDVQPAEDQPAEAASDSDGGASGGDARPGDADPGDDVVRTAGPEDLVTFLMVSDLHCNVGMARVVGEAVRLAEADAVLNAGDTVISGTSVEQFCVSALAEAVPSGVPIVVADGNHDTALTSEQERRAGNVVLAGEPITVAGVRILGDAEPNITTVTEGLRLRGEETRGEMALRLAERACEAAQAGERIDVLLVHNPRAGVTPMASGCVTLQLSGHFHRQVGPTHQGMGTLYAGGSTAGATAGRTSIGPLQSPGVMTVLRFDPLAHRPVDYRIITVGTDRAVQLGRWLPFPGPPVVPVTADLDVPEPMG